MTILLNFLKLLTENPINYNPPINYKTLKGVFDLLNININLDIINL